MTAPIISLAEDGRLTTAHSLALAANRAQAALTAQVEYRLGGKSVSTGLDCSGLLQHCYPDLPAGTEQQLIALRNWAIRPEFWRAIQSGDVLFFSHEGEASVSHVGLVSEGSSKGRVQVIHASQALGRVSSDAWEPLSNRFRDTYRVVAAGLIRPFLFRLVLRNEVLRGRKS
jgi:cell wall-associated NlpC family hydrolase